jgi:hypothetical protein
MRERECNMTLGSTEGKNHDPPRRNSCDEWTIQFWSHRSSNGLQRIGQVFSILDNRDVLLDIDAWHALIVSFIGVSITNSNTEEGMFLDAMSESVKIG